MADAIRIQVTLDPTGITQAGQQIARQLQSALDSSANSAKAAGKKIGDALSAGIEEGLRKAAGVRKQFDSVLSGSGSSAGNSLKRQEAEILSLARANAQLELAQGRGAQAAQTLRTALAQVREGTAAAVRVKTQLVAVEANLATAAGKAETAMLNNARAIARVQQIAGDAKGAIKTLGDALEKASNPNSLAAVRVQLQKTYLDTNYANSPLIGAIRNIGEASQKLGQQASHVGRSLAIGLTAPILALGAAAVKSAVDIDRQVNVLKSLLGSADAAEKRFAALVAISQKSPGLTTSLAAALDSQLRVVNVTEASINRLLPVIGKLNAVSPLADPNKFTQNLVQLISQNFERQDLKELVGQSPLAGELLKQVFNVDSPTNAKAIRESAAKLGITTVDALANALATAAANNSKFAGITESLGTQFEKLRDRVLVAFRPLGLSIIAALSPLVEKVVPIIERLSKAFDDLPDSTKQAIIVFAGLAAAIGPVLVVISTLITSFGTLAGLFAGGGALAGVGAALAPLLPLLLAVAAAVVALAVAWQTNFGGIRDITFEVIGEIQAIFNDLRLFWAEVAPDFKAIAEPALKALSDVFQFYSETIGGAWRGFWEVIKTTVRESLDVAKEFVRSGLALLRGDFQAFGESTKRFWFELWDAFIVIQARAFLSVIDAIKNGFRSLLQTTGIAKAVGSELGESFAAAVKTAILLFFPSTGLIGQLISDLNGKIRSGLGLRDAARDSARAASAGRGLDGEEITPADFANSQIAQARAAADAAALKRSRASSAGGSGESQVRALREALLQQQRTFLEQNQRLLEDANKRELESFKELYDNKTITAREFFDNKTRIEQGTLRGGIAVTEQEISAAENAIARLKPGTVERIRLEGELFKLRTDLQIKSREFYFSEIENIQATTKVLLSQRETLLADLNKFAVNIDESQLPSARIAESVDPFTQRARDAVLKAQQATIQFRKDDVALQLQEVQIQNAVNAGVLTERQGKEATLAVQRQYRDVLIQSLELQKAGLDPEAIARINIQIEQLRNLGLELSPAQAFFKGLRSEAETTAEAFERIGTALKDKFLSTLDSGIDRLTKKFGFFKDLIGDILKSLTRRIVSQLFGGGGGGFGGQQSGGGGGGIGGFLGNLFGGLFGRNQQQSQQGGNLANVGSLFSGGGQNFGSFLTGGFAGGNPAQSILGGGSGGGFNLASLFGGGGILAPPSISSGTGVFAGIPSGASSAGPNLGGLGNLGLLGNFKNLFSGIGFGKGAGTGGALASALPLLGLSLGAGVGGSSVLGQILGGAGGLAVGVGLTAAPAGLAAPLAALFSNPITAIIGGALLVGAFFLGRAAARKRDEKTSGDYLQQAIDSIREIGDGVRNDSIKGSDAKKLFESEVMATFIAQINTIKTKSVRESRLTNQTRDLRALFEKEVGPEIEAQKLRIKSGAFGRNLIPEFATGGVVGGVDLGRDSVMALLRPREMVLTIDQQMRIAQMAGRNVFAVAGVPGAGLAQQPTSSPVQPFITGGIAQPFIASNTSNDAPIEITVVINNGMSEEEATTILEKSVRGSRGRNVIVQTVRKEKSFGN